jgi:RNA polymerase sigma factor (sigma-70 family)
MVDTPEASQERKDLQDAGPMTRMLDLEAWFVSEILPLESALMQFLRNNWRKADDIPDMRQDIYLRVLEAATEHLPRSTRPFLFTIARNIVIDRYRRERIVPIDGIVDLDAMIVPSQEPGPDRRTIARDELRHLQQSLDQLPPRCREALVLKQVEGLSRKEIALRMSISESTVNCHLYDAMNLLLDILHRESAAPEKKP